MRKMTLPLLLFLMIFSASSCSPIRNNSIINPSSSNSGDGLLDKKNWTRVKGVATDYVKLKDINSKDIIEIKLGISIKPYIHVVKETSDGFLCGNKITPEASQDSQHVKTNPIIRKFDKNGKLLWEKEYEYGTYSGRVNNLLVYPDNSFLFSVQTYPYYVDNNLVSEKCYILRCDKDGEELWKRDFENFHDELLNNLFLSKNNEIIAAGNYDKQSEDNAGSDIVIMKLDASGNLLREKRFGGSDFDYIKYAKYDKELGIVISGATQSNDGDFAMDKAYRNIDFIALVDDSLNLKWVIHMNEKESLFDDQFIILNKNIYFSTNYQNGDTSNTGMVKLDEMGNRTWAKASLNTGMWARAIAVLQNGDIICGSGQQNNGALVVLDQMGNEKKRIKDLKYPPTAITPTDDGGFIIISSRTIGTVPQPPQISSVWYDTELVVIKYSSDYKVEWRKTYDKYKDELGYDFVLPLSNGKLVVDSK
jgi:hypothetical protein